VHGGDSGKEAQTIRAGVIKCIQYLSAWLALQSHELLTIGGRWDISLGCVHLGFVAGLDFIPVRSGLECGAAL
jgi:hypothetical protein